MRTLRGGRTGEQERPARMLPSSSSRSSPRRDRDMPSTVESIDSMFTTRPCAGHQKASHHLGQRVGGPSHLRPRGSFQCCSCKAMILSSSIPMPTSRMSTAPCWVNRCLTSLVFPAPYWRPMNGDARAVAAALATYADQNHHPEAHCDDGPWYNGTNGTRVLKMISKHSAAPLEVQSAAPRPHAAPGVFVALTCSSTCAQRLSDRTQPTLPRQIGSRLRTSQRDRRAAPERTDRVRSLELHCAVPSSLNLDVVLPPLWSFPFSLAFASGLLRPPDRPSPPTREPKHL